MRQFLRACARPSIQALMSLPLLALLIPVEGTAQALARPAAQTTSVDEIFAEWDSDGSAGCAVGVTRYGETVLERAYGMSDLEHAVPNTPGTIFEGGSVSKQFTAAAVNLLVIDGVVSLGDDVRRWVPELPDYGSPITLHHLMTHTSGLRDWGSVASISGWGRENRSHDHDDVIDILSRQASLNFEPGHEYSYSNSGYNLLAVVVTRASGVPFADFSKTRIFEPLGMDDTQWRDDYRRIVPGRSSAYNRLDGGWEINRPIEDVHGNGGILTTVRDLGIWNQALTDGQLGGDAFLELMHRPGVLNDGSEIRYAGGLMLGDFGGVRSVTHTGSTAGYRAYLGRFPEQGLSVAMLCNASNVSTSGNGNRVASAFLGNALRQDDPPAYALASEGYDLALYEGLYVEPVTGSPIRIEARDGVLRSGGRPLLPLSESDFQLGTTDTHYFFERVRGGIQGFRVESWEYTDRRYDRVEPWLPAPAELAGLEGTFRSEDAETTVRATFEGGTLTLWQRPNDARTFEPVYRDAFRGQGGTMVRFHRDSAGRALTMSMSLGRVYDMRFVRVEE